MFKFLQHPWKVSTAPVLGTTGKGYRRKDRALTPDFSSMRGEVNNTMIGRVGQWGGRGLLPEQIHSMFIILNIL
jgi:hypothetical protein